MTDQKPETETDLGPVLAEVPRDLFHSDPVWQDAAELFADRTGDTGFLFPERARKYRERNR